MQFSIFRQTAPLRSNGGRPLKNLFLISRKRLRISEDMLKKNVKNQKTFLLIKKEKEEKGAGPLI